MKTLLIATALTLLGAAKARAEQIMRAQADIRAHRDDVYSVNAGGWN